MGIFTKKKKSIQDAHLEDFSLYPRNETTIVRGYPDGSPMHEPYNDWSGSHVRLPIDFMGMGYPSGTFQPQNYIGNQGYGVITANNQPDLNMSEDLIDKLWKKMYERPVIVRCGSCNSHNVITNPTCVQCGAPMGDYKEMKKYG